MGKRLILSVIMSAGVVSAFSQVRLTTAQYLEQYRDFVQDVSNRSSITADQYHALDSVNVSYTLQYKTYKKSMTAHQIEEYNTLKSRYNRRKLKYRTEKLGNHIEDTSDTISSGVGKGIGSAEKGIKRTGAAVGGFIKGMFGKDEDNKSK